MVFAIFGGLLVLRWWRLAWLHLPAVVWAALVELYVRYCPLTPLENRLRALAGERTYEGGFIAHYITPSLYPPGLEPWMQDTLGTLLVICYAVIYVVAWRLHQRRKREGGSG
jgi:hypothetical protein